MKEKQRIYPYWKLENCLLDLCCCMWCFLWDVIAIAVNAIGMTYVFSIHSTSARDPFSRSLLLLIVMYSFSFSFYHYFQLITLFSLYHFYSSCANQYFISFVTEKGSIICKLNRLNDQYTVVCHTLKLMLIDFTCYCCLGALFFFFLLFIFCFVARMFICWMQFIWLGFGDTRIFLVASNETESF